MAKKLTVLLGAGFSANANYPTAGKIAEYFNRDLKEKLLCFSSSEWAWVDNKPDSTKNNGRLNFEWLAYSYIFNQLVLKYKEEMGSFVGYEDFYQFIINKFKDNIWIEYLFEGAQKELINDRDYLLENDGINKSHYLFPFRERQFSKIRAILNYLISDLLISCPLSDEQLIKIYRPFINHINTFDEVDIFTLNHDLLLERLLNLSNIKYSKGFNEKNSPLIFENTPIPIFTSNFNEKVRIYKLHGSIDLYRFNHFELNGIFWQPNGNYNYYLTKNYNEKHHIERIDPFTKNVIQDYNFDVVPKFITGTNKFETIQNDIMYKKLFESYEKIMSETETLFVSGYSFNDEHINYNLIKNTKLKFMNHNRSKTYPFSNNGKNIKAFEDL